MVVPNVIRTIIPLIVGILLGYAAKHGLELDSDLVTGVVTIILVTLYQALSRWLEVHVSQTLGRYLLALGLTKKAPRYE